VETTTRVSSPQNRTKNSGKQKIVSLLPTLLLPLGPTGKSPRREEEPEKDRRHAMAERFVVWRLLPPRLPLPLIMIRIAASSSTPPPFTSGSFRICCVKRRHHHHHRTTTRTTTRTKKGDEQTDDGGDDSWSLPELVGRWKSRVPLGYESQESVETLKGLSFEGFQIDGGRIRRQQQQEE
jgi:hypothetical protein